MNTIITTQTNFSALNATLSGLSQRAPTLENLRAAVIARAIFQANKGGRPNLMQLCKEIAGDNYTQTLYVTSTIAYRKAMAALENNATFKLGDKRTDNPGRPVKVTPEVLAQMEQLAQSLSRKDVAAQLNLSLLTVNNYLRS